MAVYASKADVYRGELPKSYIKTMVGNETFVYGEGSHLRCFLNPGGANRNFNPLGTFPAGFKVEIINTGAQDIVFDSVGVNHTIYAGELALFYYGEAWIG